MRMKIAYISNSVIPSRNANSIHVMKMCAAMARAGNEVTLFAPASLREEPNCGDGFAHYGIRPAFALQKIRRWPTRGRHYIYCRRAAIAAAGLQPDLVYTRVVEAAWFALRRGLPVVLEMHAPVEQGGRVQSLLFRRVKKDPGLLRIVVISEALRQIFIQRFPELQDIMLVCHDAADPMEQALPAQPAAEFPLRVGYVGHLYDGRGSELILRLAERTPWASFHLYGGTDEDIERVRAMAAKGSNVQVHGCVPPALIPGILARLDVLLAPYQRKVSVPGGGDTSRWMSPLKIFEYMAAGKAIVSSDLPVLREVLRHDENALLCDPEDVEAWGTALERLRADGEMRSRLASRALEEHRSRYSWDARAQQVLDGIEGRG